MIDLGFVLDKIRPAAKYRRYKTYQDLVETWEDESQTLPTIGEITAAWNSGLESEYNALLSEPPFDAKIEIEDLKIRVFKLENGL